MLLQGQKRCMTWVGDILARPAPRNRINLHDQKLLTSRIMRNDRAAPGCGPAQLPRGCMLPPGTQLTLQSAAS
jgi:hypothetical protein